MDHTAASSAARTSSSVTPQTRTWPVRLWLEAPDWLFRVLGIVFFGGFLYFSLQKYFAPNFWTAVPYCTFPNGSVLRMPWVPVLVDLTFFIMLVSFLVRLRPRERASDGWIILFTLLTAFVPLIFSVWLGPTLGLFRAEWQVAYEEFLWRQELTWYDAFLGGVLITIGNVLDVWGYTVLCRSFSIVPEARELKTSGPYRWVRHPVYLGQFLAQGGVWLFFASLHAAFILLYAAFVVMQLVRSKMEDRVLEDAFGQEYRDWKEKTFWFV